MEKSEREAKLQKLVANLTETLLKELQELGEAGDSNPSLLATMMTGATMFSAHCIAACAMAPSKTIDEQYAHIEKSAEVLGRIAADHAKKLCSLEQAEPLTSFLKH